MSVATSSRARTLATDLLEHVPGAYCSVMRRRHPEWRENQRRWRWLLDSLEGGERYRQAVYGFDPRGLPIRNLILSGGLNHDFPRTSGAIAEILADAGIESTISEDVVGKLEDRAGREVKPDEYAVRVQTKEVERL